METRLVEQALVKRLSLTLVVVTLFVSPWNSVDPINLPKMTALGILSFGVLGLLISKKSGLVKNVDKRIFILALLFIGLLILSAVVNSVNLSFSLYGTPNRNTGILTYVSLLILMVAASSIAKLNFAVIFTKTIIGVGTILAIYGLLQWRGIEPFDYVNVYGSNVFGTLGNTNFHSAFMGMVASGLFAFILEGSLSLKNRILLCSLFLLCIINVLLSSSQGLLCLAGGIAVTLLASFFSKKKVKLGILLSVAFSLGGILVAMAIFNRGPLASIIYDTSLMARGFYWTAAVRMLMGHPITGVGVDGYGDWYLRYRDTAAAEYNLGLVSDSAHNIPLDIATSGGFPLLILYIGLQVLVVKRVISVIRAEKKLSAGYLSVIAVWVAYQIQSLISINQIGLGVWGWIATGILIAYQANSESGVAKRSDRKFYSSDGKKAKLPSEALLMSATGLAIGLMISLPPYIAANKFYKAIQSGQIEKLIESAELTPTDRSRYFYVSQILMENNFESQAIPILQKGSQMYPDYFPIWSKFAENKKATPSQIAKARKELNRLDPLNPNFK